jgi:hypothetical protein
MADTTANPKENVLYVIFHGLIGLVDTGAAGFNAYMFDMHADHRYLFGNWLVESDSLEQSDILRQAPLILTLDSVIGGVPDPANNVLNPNLNLVIQLGAPLPTNLPGARAVIRLPRPRRIYYYTCGEVPDSTIKGDTSKLINGVPPKYISATRVFEYSFADPQKVQLLAGDPPVGPSLWKPDVLAEVGNRHVATLHFYDEPDQISDEAAAEQHARAEFLLSTALLGVPLTLTQASPQEFPEPPDNPQPDIKDLGILRREVTPLDGRSEALLGLQFLARCGKPRPEPPQKPGAGGGPICGGGNAQVVQPPALQVEKQKKTEEVPPYGKQG